MENIIYVNDCCNDVKNMEIFPSERPDVIHKVCKICKCNHYELTVDPGEIGVVFDALVKSGLSNE